MKDIKLSTLTTKLHFKKLTADDLRGSPSFNVVDDDGNFVAIFFIPFAAFPKQQVNTIAETGNHALGKDLVL